MIFYNELYQQSPYEMETSKYMEKQTILVAEWVLNIWKEYGHLCVD